MTVTIPEALDVLELDQPSRLPGHIRCPIHDDSTASLYVQDHRWHCFGCGVGGDAIDLVRFVTGANFGQAKQFLSGLLSELHDRPEIERPERVLEDLTSVFHNEQRHTTWNNEREAEAWVKVKWPHLSFDQLLRWGIGVGQYNLLIPHTDAEGVVRGVKTRSFVGGHKGRKSAFPGSCFTTRLYRVVEPTAGRKTLLMEGESDCWTAQSTRADVGLNVLALPSGAGVWHSSFADELKALGGLVYICFDRDDAGQAAAARVKAVLGDDALIYSPSKPYNDWTEAYIQGGHLL